MTHLRITDCYQKVILDEKEVARLFQLLLDRSKPGPITIGNFSSGVGHGVIVQNKNHYSDITSYEDW